MKRVWSITLFVSDLKKAVEFYEETLGLNKKYEYSSYAGFDCGGVEVGLRPKEKVNREEEAPNIQFLVDNVDKTYLTLKEKGVRFVVEPHDEVWGARQATFLDPDGNVLEIMQINWEKYYNVAARGFGKP